MRAIELPFTRALVAIETALGIFIRMDDYTCAGMLAIEQALEIRNTDGWATWSYYHGIGEW